MAITSADVEKIADLARLELTTEETDSFTQQLGAILSHMTKLNELDTASVEPMSHSVTATGDTEYTQRDDAVTPSLGQKSAVENAPESELGYFTVPRVIGG